MLRVWDVPAFGILMTKTRQRLEKVASCGSGRPLCGRQAGQFSACGDKEVLGDAASSRRPLAQAVLAVLDA